MNGKDTDTLSPCESCGSTRLETRQIECEDCGCMVSLCFDCGAVLESCDCEKYLEGLIPKADDDDDLDDDEGDEGEDKDKESEE